MDKPGHSVYRAGLIWGDPMGSARIGALIARSVGVVCIALGFVLGMRGLAHPDSIWLRTALGLIVTGLLAQGYALYCTLRRIREKNDIER